MATQKIIKCRGESEEKVVDRVTEEIPFTIYVNEREIATLLASPRDLEDLAIGFLITAGLIKTNDDSIDVTIDDTKWRAHVTMKGDVDTDLLEKRMYTSGCGRGILFYNTTDLMYRNKGRSKLELEKKKIFELMREFQSSSIEFKETGGVHSAALASGDRIITLREDIGRHNAIDKIVGYAYCEKIDLANTVILTSGRVSSEVVLKIQKTPISGIISRSAPTDQAIRHAEAAGITLIGFVRGERMNIYYEKGRDKR